VIGLVVLAPSFCLRFIPKRAFALPLACLGDVSRVAVPESKDGGQDKEWILGVSIVRIPMTKIGIHCDPWRLHVVPKLLKLRAGGWIQS
jgi:hypothetical protein